MALQCEEFQAETIRIPFETDSTIYTPTLDVLRTHMHAWKKCIAMNEPALVVEADFVPVVGLSQHELPFDLDKAERSLGYLYACGPRMYDLDGSGYARGHAGGAVAYTICPATASLLFEFGTEVLASSHPANYTPWDTQMGFYLKERGVQSFIPYRMLGEHGGKANPEHAAAGLARTHRADTLAAGLHFLPAYSNGSSIRFRLIRAYAKFYGLARLLAGKFLAGHDFIRADNKMQLLKYVLGRHLSLQ